MSVQSQMTRISNNVTNTLNTISEMGGTVPANATSDDMATAAATIPVARIDDASVSTTTTYSSSKIESRFAEIGTQEEIVQQVIAALGTPVFGTVDENNNIILSGELADGTYTVKYEDAEGNLIDIGALTYGEEEIVNQILISTDTDGTIFNGKGWNANMRVSSSGTIKTQSGYELTGFIPFVKGDILRGSAGIIGLIVSGSVSNTGYNVISLYNSSKTFISNIDLSASSTAEGMTINADDSFAFDSSLNSTVTESVAFVRVTTVNISDESVITVNQEIA